MKNPFIFVILTCLVCVLTGCTSRQKDHISLQISGEGWKIWLDESAPWAHDQLYLPGEFSIEDLPVNKPSIGWQELYTHEGVDCLVPGTAEEYFGTSNEWTYHGVMWFFREVFIPDDFRDKLVFFEIESFRHRLELYVNEQIAGYDLIALTPYKTEISRFIKPGQVNRFALRVTNPGGQRGWEDHHLHHWNDFIIPATYDYGGIAGDIHLQTSDSIYAEDLFIKNLLPASSNNVELSLRLINLTNTQATIQYYIRIDERWTGKTVFRKRIHDKVFPGANEYRKTIEVPNASQWSVENPEMYTCRIDFYTNEFTGSISQPFGFRVFELRDTQTGKKFFFNDKRIRLKSAIDWGQYAYNGLFPTHEMAMNSMTAIREVGHNMLSFHRRIGDKRLMNLADSLGILLYEEPGGLHFWSDHDSTFTVNYMREKIRRMVIRARNHPGMIIYTLANEDYDWFDWREGYMRMINEMDDTRLIANSSGYAPVPNYHIKPYQSVIELDHIDEHTVGSGSRFEESLFHTHHPHADTVYSFYGEVACYTGPPAVVDLMRQADGGRGFDLNLYEPLYHKINDVFYSADMANHGSGKISDPSDITRQASRGLMYANGRLGQIIMSHDRNNGYAINGWSDGPQTVDAWSSAIVDMGRNLKGPAEDMRFWNKPLQVAIFRNNGKYFQPGDTASFRLVVINEGILEKGEYTLDVRVRDGMGIKTWFLETFQTMIEGDDVFAQEVTNDLAIVLQKEWHPGHITVEARLFDGPDTLATGHEQILLQNRAAYAEKLAGKRIAVVHWDEAKNALTEAGLTQLSHWSDDVDLIMAGDMPGNSTIAQLLNKVETEKVRLIIRFNQQWADALYNREILSEKVYAWGGYHSHDWNGNGWGYIDHYVGDQAIPSSTIISTRSWEVPGDPLGFYPFKSHYPQEVHGLYMARTAYPEPIWGELAGKGEYLREIFTPDRELLILLGKIHYGEGKIILAPSYPVDDGSPFNDMVFFNLIHNN